MIGKGFADLKREVIDAGLCTRCGSCVGVCKEQAISIPDPLGDSLPELKGNCTNNGACYAGCSGKTVLWPKLNRQVFGQDSHDYLIGQTRAIYVGFARDEQVRQGGASGGIVSAISIYLLENRLVDGVVTLVDSQAEPYRAAPQIVTDRAGVLAAAQSRYSISPVNTIFQELRGRQGNFAYVGLPCQVHSLRKLQAMDIEDVRNIKYIIGAYCGNILHFDSVRSFLRRQGIKDMSQVASLKYRAGAWPGRMEVRLKDGRIYGLEKFYANYLIPFYIMQRCLLCTDLTNEFTDISVGDGWSPAYEARQKGWSIVLGRTHTGADLLAGMQETGRIELHPISNEAAVNMHSHGLDLKKRGAFLRIQARAGKGLATPEYGYHLEHASLLRRVQESLIDSLFHLCSFELARRLIDLVPVEWVGRAFKLFRKVWIRSTRSTKRSGLLQTRFITYDDGVVEKSRENGPG